MKKRGVSSISLILFSIFSIILFSSIVSAEACSGSTTIPSCFLLTSSGEYVCNQFSQACHWYLGSCLANSGVYCDDITNVPSCGAIACPGSTICTSGPCCDTSVPGGAIRPSTYICATKNAFFMCNEATDIVRIEGEVQYCNGVNTACTGTIRWEVQSPSYQSCSTQNGCIDDYFFPNVCTCAGSTSWSLPPTTAYISSCSSCAVPPSPGFPGCAGTCTDTDGGLGYTTYGYTYLAGYGSSTSQYDSCSSSTTLNEKYCVGGVQSQNSYSCTNLGSQYSCSGGRCVCTPNCAGKNCGSDGCGSNCGSCSGTQTCVSGVCQDNCMATGAAGCTSVGTASNQCCSGMCIEGTCRSSCSGYTGSQNRCTSTSTIYQSFGICTTAGCDQSVAALSGGTYYGDCSGRSDGTSADRDSLAGGYSANGICCTNSAVATPTGFGSSCDGSDADYCMEGTILCTGSCSDSTGSTYENSVALCHDGSDNDCDGNTDCSDSQCVGIASENTASSCADGVDNDCDGTTDCSDSGCTSLLTSTACDGSDADSCAEGFRYVCGSGCSDSTGSTYENSVSLCHDGSDNDCDGNTDCSDSQCVGIASENTASSCADGVDNDCDGTTDCSDSGCTSLLTSTACDGSDADSCAEGFRYVCGSGCSDSTGSTYENSVALCHDGSDNDCDGNTDCSDSQCVGIASENTASSCADGVDNDCDGNTDCADSQCTSLLTSTACDGSDADSCAEGFRYVCGSGCSDSTGSTYENTFALCTDGSDNDCEGGIDCADASCNGVSGTSNCDQDGRCAGAVRTCSGGTLSACSITPISEVCNSIDDNCDGSVDNGITCTCDNGDTQTQSCGTGACFRTVSQTCVSGAWTPACTPGTAGTETTTATCSDSSDNDCDGTTDCSDSGCTSLLTSTTCDGAADGDLCREGFVFLCGGACSDVTGTTTENTFALCTDGSDNDCDTSTDCADSGCTGLSGTSDCDQDGLCAGAVRTCSGGSLSACSITPIGEVCNNQDDNCDGSVDNGITCSCTIGETDTCGSNIGECEYGITTCLIGGIWGACVGGVTPVTENTNTLCHNGLDDSCNSLIDCADPTCLNVVAETCGNSIDDDCDGTPDDGCLCAEGATQPCGTDVGECAFGVQTCTGGAWGTCIGGVTAIPEVCGDGLDNDCDGTPDNGCGLGICGDGAINTGEDCDDGGTVNGDGCSAACTIESGWTCVGEPSVCNLLPSCGDGNLDVGEECDDDDNSPGDGCDGSCNVEDGWVCVGAPSVCSHECSFQANSAHWNPLQVLDGEDVRMEFILIGDCNGEEITFEVREDDLLSSSYVATPASIIYGPSSTYGTWTAIIVADSGGPEYYFIATITSTGESTSSSTNYANELKVLEDSTCYLPLEGRSIAYCSDYDETLCEFDVCGVGVNITLLDPTIQCGGEYECGCIWDSDTDTCGYMWNGTTNLGPNAADIDGDGILNGDDPDFDGDGNLDAPFDINPNGDHDSDGTINSLDGDYINSGDIDGDGIPNGDDPDFDGDDVLDFPFNDDPNGDHDSDGTINSLDGDYINSGDIDGDGIPNGDDPDFDGDDALEGYYSGIDPNGDIDGDGTPNIRDRDMDGDGVNNGDDLDFDRNGSNDGRYIGFTEDSEFGIGTCSYLESTGGGECINGVRVWTLSHTWTWSPENVQYFLDNGVYLDPFSQESKCQDINRQLECSPGAQVNFFGIYQLVIVIAIVALIYVLYILRKRNLNKKKKVKHKVKSKRSKKRR